MKTNTVLHFWHAGTQTARALYHQKIRVFGNLRGRRWMWRPLTISLVVLILSSLVMLSIILRTSGHTAYAAVGEYSLSLPGVRPDPVFDLSGYLEVPYAPEHNPSGGKITIEAWVKRNESDRIETVVGNGYINSYWLGFSSSGKLNFHPHGFSSGVDGNGTVNTGVWTHIAVTYDGTTRSCVRW